MMRAANCFLLEGARGAVAVTAVLLLAGCSALKVDVDVYKGPLTSQRELQLRQFSTLALAAKPLLAELRNAAAARKGFKFTQTQDKDFMWRFFDYEFEDDIARFANGALSYYEDLEPVGGLARTRAAETSNQLFKESLQRFEVDRKIDCQLAVRVLSGGDKATPVQKAVAWFLRAGTMSEGSDRSVICASGQRDISYATSSAALGKRQIENVRDALCPNQDAQCRISKSVSEAYLALGDRSSGMAAWIAKSTLPNDTEDARVLEVRLFEIGKAFGDAREAMLQLWETSDLLLDQAYRRLSKERAHLTASFIANTTEPRILACFMSAFETEPGVDQNVRELVLQEVPRDWSAPGDRKLRANKFVRGSKAIEGIANAYPLETASTLTRINERLKGLNPDETGRLEKCPQYATASDGRAELRFASKKYGLARGTAVENGFDSVLERIVAGLASLTSPSRYSFDEGRGRRGIVTLSQRYVELLAQPQTIEVKADVVEAKRQLEETLIPFAERVLYVANNVPLLNRDATQDAAVVRNAALLQAVGNTLIVLVDDIRRQDDHERKSQSRRNSEAVAINRAFSGQPGATYDALLVEITSTAKRLQVEAARLEAEGKKAATQGEQAGTQASSDAARLEAAKAAATGKAKEAENAVKEAARFRAATITVVTPKTAKSVAGVLDDASAADDRKAVAARVAALPTASKPEATVAAIKSWIGEELDNDKPAGVLDARGQRLAAAKEFFDLPMVSFPNLPDSGPPAAFSVIKARLGDWLTKKENVAANLKKEQAKAERAFEDLQKQVGAKTRIADTAKTQAKALEDAAAASNTSVSDLNTALQAIKEVRDTVLAQASGPDAATPTNLMQLLGTELKVKAEAAASGSEAAKRFTLAAAYVGKTSPAAVMAVEAEAPGRSALSAASRERTQVDVLDDLIAQLRQQRLRAIANGDAARAKNYEDALRAAFDQRGAMAYLRPASSYLRNVYAATAIQADPDTEDTNMLTAKLRPPPPAEAILARASVEKQFWDNVSTVSVGGAGAANYVLVKDDIGNWNLKALSSDTNSIIQSAQSLALFNLGKKFDVNLLRRTELQRRVDSSESTDNVKAQARAELGSLNRNPSTGTGASTSGLSSVRRKYADDYGKRTATDVGNLLSAIIKVNTSLADAWKRDIKGEQAATTQVLLQSFISGESEEQKVARQLLEAVPGKPEAERAASGADAVIDSLRAMRRMRDRLSAEVARSDALVEQQTNALKSAKDASDAAIKAHAALKPDASTTEVDEAKDKVTKTAEAVTKVQGALSEAKDNRTKAAGTVMAFFNELMATSITSRLDVIKAADTAYSFIGEAATAK